ncbi:MAG TPA: TM0106 family RecB-like putative nuclease, partial [Bacteroidales bacterium]|nr:TM0106 family RecB-like putative nuclease [Bacteroidales bacterium]
MKRENQSIRYSASDLVNYLGCKHLTELDRQTVLGKIPPPDWKNPALALIQQKGIEHEQAYVNHLKFQDLCVRELDGHSGESTLQAMKEGVDIITQARFEKDGWVGIADVLKKVPGESTLGNYHYEIEDTKLAAETKAGTVLQLCLYADLLGNLQGRIPENLYVIKPGEAFSADQYRYPEFEAYYRFVKKQFIHTLEAKPEDTYPMPVAKCDTCRWWKDCNQKWHDDDHLSLVAGIRSNQLKELEEQGIKTLETYAGEEKPFRSKPSKGNEETYKKIHDQAKIQLKGRKENKLLYELLPVMPQRGLNRLPKPSKGDIYFDIEGDHFYEEGGLEYLLGISLRNASDAQEYKGFWAKTRKEEKEAFIQFMEFTLTRWKSFPDMHIYHYAPYEPSAIKRLASRHAVFEEEVDRLLRSERFIDLFAVIKETLIASVESYSLKDIEQFTGYTRKANLRMASEARRQMSIALDFKDFTGLPDQDLELIELYNKDDCEATKALHSWIEQIYQEQITDGISLERPEEKTGDASENISEEENQASMLYGKLVGELPEDPADWDNKDKAKWLLAHQVEFYRREMRSAWWEFFRLKELEPHELLEERKGIYDLRYIKTLPESKRAPIDRYSYPPQEISLEKGKELYEPQGSIIGTIHNFSLKDNIVDIKKRLDQKGNHPHALFIKDIVSNQGLVPSFFHFIQSVIDYGIDGDGPYRAGRDLLLKYAPRLMNSETLQLNSKQLMEENAIQTMLDLNEGILPVQGPPGTGKTYLGGGLIAELVKRGKKTGVTAVSHKVIRTLLDKAVERGNEKGINVQIGHKSKANTGDGTYIKDKNAAFAALEEGKVVGGTAWLWSNDD